MERDLQFVVNNPERLIIRSPAESMDTIYLVFSIVIAVALLYSGWRMWIAGKRVASVVMAVILVAIASFVVRNMKTGYQMDMNRAADSVTMTSFSGSNVDHPSSTDKIALHSVLRADIEQNRNRRRLVLTTENGPVHPLGMGWEYMDSQFRAAGIIQSFLHKQNPDEPTQP